MLGRLVIAGGNDVPDLESGEAFPRAANEQMLAGPSVEERRKNERRESIGSWSHVSLVRFRGTFTALAAYFGDGSKLNNKGGDSAKITSSL
jgi:hypothetical protein